LAARSQTNSLPYLAAAVRKEARTGDPEYARSIDGEFLDQAFRQDIATVRLWQEYQNRTRQRRLDSGLGFIELPDKEYLARLKAADDARSVADADGIDESRPDDGPKLEVRTLEVNKLRVKACGSGH
jgi:hypothetical protein